MASVGEGPVALAYFNGGHAAVKAVTDALNTAGVYSQRRSNAWSDKPADWKAAAGMLTRAMGR